MLTPIRTGPVPAHPPGERPRGAAERLRAGASGALPRLEGRGHGWFVRQDAVVPVVRPGSLPAVLRRTEMALADAARPVGRRAVRIPAGSIVVVRSRPALAPPARLAMLPPPSGSAAPPHVPGANDNGLASSPRRRLVRIVLREMMALTLLAATLAAVYYVGRMHAFQNVIVVPEPWSDRSAIG